MFDESYDKYIREIYGYNSNKPYNYNLQNRKENYLELERYYPEIYKKINPMIDNYCRQNINRFDEEEIEKMAEKVCSSLENTEFNDDENNRYKKNNKKNNFLNDLIKILIIKELICCSKTESNKIPYNFLRNDFKNYLDIY